MNQRNEDSNHPLSDWHYEVSNDDTRLGYVEWLEHRWEEDAGDLESIDIPELIDQQAARAEGWEIAYSEAADSLTLVPVFGSGLLCWAEVHDHVCRRMEEGSILHRKAEWLMTWYNGRKARELKARYSCFTPGVRVRWNDPDRDAPCGAEGVLEFIEYPADADDAGWYPDMTFSIELRLDDGEVWESEVRLDELEIIPASQ